jgi:lincosamide nucleotidyltransferase A/C/D/E
MIEAETVVELLELFEAHDIDVVVDGGWGVDALLSEQTRPHDDLDIAIQHKEIPKLREILETRGFVEIPRDDSRDCNFVLEDDEGNHVDVHSYTFDENGNNHLRS